MSREERREWEGAEDLWESSMEDMDATDMRLARIRLSLSSPGEGLKTKVEKRILDVHTLAQGWHDRLVPCWQRRLGRRGQGHETKQREQERGDSSKMRRLL